MILFTYLFHIYIYRVVTCMEWIPLNIHKTSSLSHLNTFINYNNDNNHYSNYSFSTSSLLGGQNNEKGK